MRGTNDVIRLVIGSAVGAIAMFAVGFLLWATPLNALGYSSLGEQQSTVVQQALAANVQHTGRYIVPDRSTQDGTVLYGRGPVATVDYNVHGFAASDRSALVGGLIQEFVVVLMIGFSLFALGARVVDFATRARLVIGFSSAAALMITLSDPIFAHADWRFAIYNLIASTLMLCAGGLVVARWFLPIEAR